METSAAYPTTFKLTPLASAGPAIKHHFGNEFGPAPRLLLCPHALLADPYVVRGHGLWRARPSHPLLAAQRRVRFFPLRRFFRPQLTARARSTCIAVAGKDYAIVAADTRMSNGYSIMTRNKSKCAQLTDHCVLASSGMQADVQALHKNLWAKMTWFEHQACLRVRVWGVFSPSC